MLRRGHLLPREGIAVVGHSGYRVAKPQYDASDIARQCAPTADCRALSRWANLLGPARYQALLWNAADEHHIAGLGAARERKLLAILCPGKIEDLASGKIRDLFLAASVDGLSPDVGDTLQVSKVGQISPVLGPMDYGITPKNRAWIVEGLDRFAAGEGNHTDSAGPRVGVVVECNPLPIWRDSRIC